MAVDVKGVKVGPGVDVQRISSEASRCQKEGVDDLCFVRVKEGDNVIGSGWAECTPTADYVTERGDRKTRLLCEIDDDTWKFKKTERFARFFGSEGPHDIEGVEVEPSILEVAEEEQLKHYRYAQKFIRLSRSEDSMDVYMRSDGSILFEKDGNVKMSVDKEGRIRFKSGDGFRKSCKLTRTQLRSLQIRIRGE